MSIIRRSLVLTSMMLGTLALTASTPVPESPNWTRLRSMPWEQRQRLAARLKTFDDLSAADQEPIRQIDRKIAEESSDERDNDLAVLRRYHLWLRTLNEAQRKEVNAAAPDRRMVVIARIMEAQRAAQASSPFLQRLSEFGAQSPYEMAYAIKVWLKLNLAEREEVLRLADNARRERLHAFGKQYKLKNAGHPPESELATLYGEAERQHHLPSLPVRPSGVGKTSTEDNKTRRFRQNVAEYQKLETTTLKKVTPDHLYQFSREVPAWLCAGFEDVPPEDCALAADATLPLGLPQRRGNPATESRLGRRGDFQGRKSRRAGRSQACRVLTAVPGSQEASGAASRFQKAHQREPVLTTSGTDPMAELDDFWMRRALAEAERGRGSVEPNPMVGAVVVRAGQAVGVGHHERFGGPHAEVNALDQASESCAWIDALRHPGTVLPSWQDSPLHRCDPPRRRVACRCGAA